MKVGDVVKMAGCRAVFANDKISGSLGYKAPKGEQFVFMLLGSEPVNGEHIDPLRVLHDLGWAPITGTALTKAGAHSNG